MELSSGLGKALRSLLGVAVLSAGHGNVKVSIDTFASVPLLVLNRSMLLVKGNLTDVVELSLHSGVSRACKVSCEVEGGFGAEIFISLKALNDSPCDIKVRLDARIVNLEQSLGVAAVGESAVRAR